MNPDHRLAGGRAAGRGLTIARRGEQRDRGSKAGTSGLLGVSCGLAARSSIGPCAAANGGHRDGVRPPGAHGRPRATALAAAVDDEAVQAQTFFIQGMAELHLGRDRESSACMRRVLSLRPASGLAHQWLTAIEALGQRPCE
jgi:hypothetical protein